MSAARAAPSPLARLAAAVGIVPEYVDQTGRERRVTTDDTRRAILTALGFDVSTDDAARDALATLRAEARNELIAPVCVVEREDPRARVLAVQLPAGRQLSGPWRLRVGAETGEEFVTEGPWRGSGTLELTLPPLEIGYHDVQLELNAGGRRWNATQKLIVVPSRCVTPAELVGDRGLFGIITNLYTIRSPSNWGVGDFGDLSSLVQWSASVGADFVGMNPLHALLNRGADVSPYNPVSRLFRNPIYIRVTDVPELALDADLCATFSAPEFEARLDALRDTADVRYAQVMATKGLALDALYRVFATRVRGTDADRAHEYDAYVATHEPALSRFATWMAIAECQSAADWRTWPDSLRDASSEAVRRFASERAERVDFHRWLQFEADRQLREAAGRARSCGMRIGLYQDLAIGTSAAGADAWAFADLFVRGASVGAPPDPYAAAGQNWGLPPIDPRALRRNKYEYFINLVRNAFRHSGALRIDHVMGLFRLFWIPEGMDGSKGAYVRYPSADLLGILALESVRNRGIVVGEDLGTVPTDVPPALEKWGVLSSKVLFFERDRRGRFRPAAAYPRLALATADTHDMASIDAFWDGRDIDIRAKVGLIADENAAELARVDRERQRAALLRRLASEKVLPHAREPKTRAELRAAVHGFLCRTPAQLVGLSLDDLAGELDPVNVPGVGPDRYPSWTRKMRRSLETITASDDVRTALRCDGRGGTQVGCEM